MQSFKIRLTKKKKGAPQANLGVNKKIVNLKLNKVLSVNSTSRAIGQVERKASLSDNRRIEPRGEESRVEINPSIFDLGTSERTSRKIS